MPVLCNLCCLFLIFLYYFSHANEEARNDIIPVSVSSTEKIHSTEQIVEKESGNKEKISLVDFLIDNSPERDIITEL